MRADAYVLACATMAALASTTFGSSIQFTVATAGPHAVYAGSAAGTDLFLAGTNAPLSASAGRPTPQQYYFDVEDERFIYVVVWGQPSADGVLAEMLYNGVAVVSGDPAWEVYATGASLGSDAEAPSVSEVGQQIRRATRRFAWGPAAVIGGNGVGLFEVIEAISSQAAWMWTPAQETGPAMPPASAGPCLIFRISPARLWPEMELWQPQSGGVGPESGGGYTGSGGFLNSGGGGGSGTSSFTRPSSTSNHTISNPFDSYDPPNSASSLPTVPSYEPSTPRVPGDSTDDGGSEQDKPDTPEPASALLFLVSSAFLRRR